jgi:3-oxoacyl-[acyl-carrier-protein] synthase III
MSEKIETQIVSRRVVLSLLGLATAFGAGMPATVLTTSDAEAQTAGTERRQDRRQGRTERRQERRTSRTERRDVRRESRSERRDTRRTGTTGSGTSGTSGSGNTGQAPRQY